jgi:hypothetical protein
VEALMLFGQAPDSTIASWIHLLVQTGCLGLLAIVIYQVPRLLDRFQAVIGSIVIYAREEGKDSRTAFEMRNNKTVEAIVAQTVALDRKLDMQTAALGQKLDKVADALSIACKHENAFAPKGHP